MNQKTATARLTARQELQPAGTAATQQPVFDLTEISTLLHQLRAPLTVISDDGQVGLQPGNQFSPNTLGMLPAAPPSTLGDPGFQQTYGTKFSYFAGAMANGIASAELVIALGEAGLMGSFGAAGLGPDRINPAIDQIQAALGPDGPYAFNLINSPNEPAMEARTAQLYLDRAVRTVEASAYVDLTIPLVHYRLAGLEESPLGEIRPKNRIIAKLSRREVAKLFLSPAPEDILQQLLADEKITPRQAELARHVPVADDITVEADSGGHTDKRPLIAMMPGMIALRNELQEQYHYPTPVRIGAGGGISTPEAAAAAFMLGAAYIVTGSVNQSCLEAGTSDHTRALLAQASMADVVMAPSSDMFEMGVKVQVLKRGTMFPMRAQKLYELYSRYDRWEDVPQEEREKVEKTIFQQDFDSVWDGTVQFFQQRDPRQIERANRDERYKMALVFRWYLGLSSRWANTGQEDRKMDYQIWCGPSMGAFNDWVRGTYLEETAHRRVGEVGLQILQGAAYLHRVRLFEQFVSQLPPELKTYQPKPLN